jgi:hypothetical protein
MGEHKEPQVCADVEWSIKGNKLAPDDSARIEQGYQLFRINPAQFVVQLHDDTAPHVHPVKVNFIALNMRCTECPAVSHPLHRSRRSNAVVDAAARVAASGSVSDEAPHTAHAIGMMHGRPAHVILHELGVGSWMDAVETPFTDRLMATQCSSSRLPA